MEDVSNARRVALKIFGPAGSGKTWLTRIIEKEVILKNENIAFIYTKIPRMEPTFQVVYRIALENFVKNYIGRLNEKVRTMQGNNDLNAWKSVISEPSLATSLFNIASKSSHDTLAYKWLIGDKLTASELKNIGLLYSLDSDYERFSMLVKLINEISKIFSSSVLIVDELENASVKLAISLGDGLRDLLDEFGDKFALICSFTAQKEEEWYDHGYSEAFARRLDYTIQIDSLKKDVIPDFLKKHHELYRKPDSKPKDQIIPFEEDSAIKLLEKMSPGHHYPGYYLPNCGSLARLAVEAGAGTIDNSFIEKNFSRVHFK